MAKRAPVGGTGSSPNTAKAPVGDEVVEVMDEGPVAPMWWRAEKEAMMEMFARHEDNA